MLVDVGIKTFVSLDTGSFESQLMSIRKPKGQSEFLDHFLPYSFHFKILSLPSRSFQNTLPFDLQEK